MKKIAMDLSTAQPQSNTKVNGGGEYAVFLLSLLCKENITLDVLLDSKKGVHEGIERTCAAADLNKIYFSNNQDLTKVMASGNYDTLFFPVCHPKYENLVLDKNQRLIAGIHDLSTIEQANVYRRVYGKKFFSNDGKDFLRRIWKYINAGGDKKKAIACHKKLFHLTDNQISYTVSYSTRTEIKYYFPEIEEIPVFYTPETAIKQELDVDENTILSSYNVEQRGYFLFCSVNRWNKNNAIALETLDQYFTDHKECSKKAVVLGTVGESAKYLPGLVKNKDRFVFKGYVDRVDMDVLYKHAHAFVYPSVLEGFGLPPIEAMRYGVVSLCSISTSITEICSNAAIYFDPYSREAIYKAIIKSFDEEYTRIVKKHIAEHYEEIQEKRQEGIRELLDLVIGA